MSPFIDPHLALGTGTAPVGPDCRLTCFVPRRPFNPCIFDLMPAKKMTVHATAKTALPDSANRPKTRVAGSTKKNTRMQPVLDEKAAKAARKKTKK